MDEAQTNGKSTQFNENLSISFLFSHFLFNLYIIPGILYALIILKLNLIEALNWLTQQI